MKQVINYITGNLVRKVIEENEPFLTEYEFQFALAMEIKEQFPELKVKIEQKVYCDDEDKENCRCDIVAYNNDKKFILLIELKYVVTLGTQSDKSSMGSRSSFISDIKRLQDLKDYPKAQKYCIFVSNKKAVYCNNSTAKGAADYFNKLYANEEKWKIVDNHNYNPSARFLIVNVDETPSVPPEYYCY